MCGLVGFASKNEDNIDIKRAINAIWHRGPDGNGAWSTPDKCCQFGHTRLAINDLTDGGVQPMTSFSGRVTIAYNGELYNSQSLLKKHLPNIKNLNITSDTRVLVELIDKCGISILPELNGIFAFAVFMSDTNSLYLVRDRFGVKPLYYHEIEGQVTFSSELKGIGSVYNFNKDYNCETIFLSLIYQWNPNNSTIFKSVKKLQPGHYLRIQDGKILEIKQWFKLNSRVNSSNAKLDEKYYIKETRKCLEQAVVRQLMSDVPLGALLSGGVDSSAIVALASQKVSKMKCYTIMATEQGEEFKEDLIYAKSVSDHFNCELNVVEVNGYTFADKFHEMVLALEEPVGDPACVNVMLMSEKAKSDGVSVLLSGVGGDDIFTGYRRHQAIKLDEKLSTLKPYIPHNIIGRLVDRLPKSTTTRRILKYLDGFRMTGDERIFEYFKWNDQNIILDLFTDDLKSYLKNLHPTQEFKKYFIENRLQNTDNLSKMLSLEKRFFLGEHNLLYNDKMSMHNGVEVRVPFLDNDLVNMADKIPRKLLMKNFTAKHVLKKAVEDLLPRNLIYRRKTGFGLPIREWSSGAFRDLIIDTMTEDNLKKTNVFKKAKIDNLLTEHFEQRRDHSYLLTTLCSVIILLSSARK